MIRWLLAAQSGIRKMLLAGASRPSSRRQMAAAHVKSRALKPWSAVSLSPD
jgi:hypothetical protein